MPLLRVDETMRQGLSTFDGVDETVAHGLSPGERFDETGLGCSGKNMKIILLYKIMSLRMSPN